MNGNTKQKENEMNKDNSSDKKEILIKSIVDKQRRIKEQEDLIRKLKIQKEI